MKCECGNKYDCLVCQNAKLREAVREARESLSKILGKIYFDNAKEACHCWSFDDYNYARVELDQLDEWATICEEWLSKHKETYAEGGE